MEQFLENIIGILQKTGMIEMVMEYAIIVMILVILFLSLSQQSMIKTVMVYGMAQS